jgi:hypothetical protein
MKIGALAETASHERYLVARGELECVGDLRMGAAEQDEKVTVRLPRRAVVA